MSQKRKEKMIKFPEIWIGEPSAMGEGLKIPLSLVIKKILPELEDRFYLHLEGEDNSWRTKRNWKSYKKQLEENDNN